MNLETVVKCYLEMKEKKEKIDLHDAIIQLGINYVNLAKEISDVLCDKGFSLGIQRILNEDWISREDYICFLDSLEEKLTSQVYPIGAEATIVDAIGSFKDHGEDYFYYDGTIKQVPIGTVGTISEVGPSAIKLNISSIPFREWILHPDEIEVNNFYIGDEIEIINGHKYRSAKKGSRGYISIIDKDILVVDFYYLTGRGGKKISKKNPKRVIGIRKQDIQVIQSKYSIENIQNVIERVISDIESRYISDAKSEYRNRFLPITIGEAVI